MLFNSLSYALFLWTVYVLWWMLHERRSLRHAMLLVASVFFYVLAPTSFASLLATSIVVVWVAGGRIHAARATGRQGAAKTWLAAALVINLGILAVFKYFDFFAGSVQVALRGAGIQAELPLLQLMLPLGISFYTFQALSYAIDVQRGYLQPARNLLDFATYVAFFPTLVAGPILRATDFLPQLERPAPPTRERIGSGLFQILQGLAKKLLMADVLGSHLVNPLLDRDGAIASLDALQVLLLGLGFIIQLYGDFAGYSDIAIGSARLLGFDLRINFNSPLKSASVDEFWRRWHISMSTWFRDYVFFPLAGKRATLRRLQAATLITFVTVGLWHGAAWTFVVFGVIHGFALMGTRLFRTWTGDAGFRKTTWWWWTCFLATLLFVCLTVLLYRAPTLGDWLQLMRGLGNWSIDGLALPWQIWLVLAIGLGTHLLPQEMVDRVERRWIRMPSVVQGAVTVMAILLFFGLHPPGVTPFIYFKF